jgi:hypothetical protein
VVSFIVKEIESFFIRRRLRLLQSEPLPLSIFSARPVSELLIEQIQDALKVLPEPICKQLIAKRCEVILVDNLSSVGPFYRLRGVLTTGMYISPFAVVSETFGSEHQRRPSPEPRLTLFHELGHALDDVREIEQFKICYRQDVLALSERQCLSVTRYTERGISGSIPQRELVADAIGMDLFWQLYGAEMALSAQLELQKLVTSFPRTTSLLAERSLLSGPTRDHFLSMTKPKESELSLSLEFQSFDRYDSSRTIQFQRRT